MSTRSTYILVDNVEDESIISKISVFVYNYLINPISYNKSNKVALFTHPIDVNNIPIAKPLDWITLTKYIASFKNLKNVPNHDLLKSIKQILQSLILTANKLKTCDIIIISQFNDNYNWEKYSDKLKTVLKSYDNINLICIDCFDGSSSLHDDNIEILNSSILVINENNEKSFTYTISEAINSLTKQSFFTPKFKKPVEIYSYSLQILGIPDLEFNISAYPFVKRNTLTDYLTTKSIDLKNHTKIHEKYVYYYEDIKDDKSGEKELKEINNSEFIIDGYKFGTSKFLITDLPQNMMQLDSIKSMIITGFFPRNTIPPWYLKQDSLIILPYSKNIKNTTLVEKDTYMFSELWYSMIRQKVFATIRFVKKNGNDIKYGILYPQGYVDRQTEKSGQIDFGCFIFVETIYQDDEKLVNLPNLLNWKIKDEKLQSKMDDLVESFCIDKDDDDDNNNNNNNNNDNDNTNKTDEPPIESLVVSMNEIPVNDMFYNLRESILNAEKQQNPDEFENSKILSETTLMDIRKYNSPLMDIERLIYLCSYFILQQHLLDGGNPETPLFEMFEQQGMPMQVIKKWLDTAKDHHIFRPIFQKKKDLNIEESNDQENK
jgi:hypothetical protein